MTVPCLGRTPTLALLLLALVSSATGRLAASSGPAAPGLAWQSWSPAVFQQAQQEHKFVLLDLEAVWCHWCHVMDEVTYRDPTVRHLLQSHYVLVKVDQDSQPDISNRYEDYGWPATVVFDARAHEIVKRQGYLPPRLMASMLQAIVDDPSPGPSVQPEPPLRFPRDPWLSARLRAELRQEFDQQYDPRHQGWGTGHKYLDWDSVEYALGRARQGDPKAARQARGTLDAALRLLDPAWGGVYQYSVEGDWDHPHVEKIMQMQAEDLRLYALAYAQWHEPAYRNAAQSIAGYLARFLTSPEGAFYASQDADLVPGAPSASYFQLDDAGRRARGMPRVDTHRYARENGWAISGLVALYCATGESRPLDAARRAAEWVLAHRALPGGGFRHGAHDTGGPFLGDTVAMERAFLALYGATGDQSWLERAAAAGRFIARRFASPSGPGFITAPRSGRQGLAPHPERDENVALARTANLLFRYTGNRADQAMARSALRYLAAPPIARRFPAASVLLVDDELSRAPLHITVVGSRDDATAGALFDAARRYPDPYKRLEWWDPRTGPQPNPDVQLPPSDHAVAYLCSQGVCSTPITQPAQVALRARQFGASSRRP